MPITRIFRVRIDSNLRNEFELNFASLSVHTVTTAPGFISTRILKPTKWSPDEYVMISEWKDETALKAFAGKEWSQAVIPYGMERFVVECWVHHYEYWI